MNDRTGTIVGTSNHANDVSIDFSHQKDSGGTGFHPFHGRRAIYRGITVLMIQSQALHDAIHVPELKIPYQRFRPTYIADVL